MVNVDRVALRAIMQGISDEVQDIPNEGNNQDLKKMLMMTTRVYNIKKQFADSLVGEAEHGTIVDDLSSMVEHINSYRSLLGLPLM